MEESLEDHVLRVTQKFIDKVEDGRARSKETYQDMKELKEHALRVQHDMAHAVKEIRTLVNEKPGCKGCGRSEDFGGSGLCPACFEKITHQKVIGG